MKQFGRLLSWIEESISGFLLISTTLLLFTNVLLRYVFSNSTTWAEELIRYGMIWVTFIGGSICARNKLHVGIDIVLTYFKPFARKVLETIAELMSAFFCAILTLLSFQNTMLVFETAQKSPALMMPIWLVYLAMPIGSFLMTVRFLQSAWKTANDQHKKNDDPLDMSTL
ncbi:TRAP transporter small permease [Acidaminobacter hydrogenoformans]|uniref:C4-dicarboxylate transporter, DctQ subunit n=1 Tax=Acidaminobacter hydrogenoformans DSM 2784 TaxID=1120920 RepID=A0A1G5S6R4_9FIRM|nr:TRAP transporter small permease [Acidaminobacter hydrogenoformans]SCZ82064.1 C4-dicarboxylate transporter, DctQ subunit [Acidaminobacter hydrogenoformans DSM 2784]